MYSCYKEREIVVTKGKTSWPGFNSVNLCRFDQRYTKLHQGLGCAGCKREWDWSYLKQQGLLK